jgi:hypothetical protein
MFRAFLSILSCLRAAGCDSNDPRLAGQLYQDALELSNEGKFLESKALMEEIVRRFPEKPEGMLANQDIYRFDVILNRKAEDERRQVRLIIRMTCDALRRYRNRYGEYPVSLQRLVPEYGLDQIPVTPWGHPLFYRPFASAAQQTTDRRGRALRFDSYHLASFGTDLAPGGEDMAADTLVVNGTIIQEKSLPPIPDQQPIR